MIKTENLVILFTDIAGFTEATSLHSREQNQRILDKHNSILLPIVRRFHGRHIKSIGDALLLVFSSPTDAMRCGMAMQDALHEYNLSAPQEEEIHIRVAASLGEVRISKGDIFGEPVNVTSRIEGITPADEIYFSEAVYLAMNKAEVPAIEVGVRELKGISKPIRIFSIPRFAENRLVPVVEAKTPEDPRLGFPFGGMHLSGAAVANSWSSEEMAATILNKRSLAITSLVGIAAVCGFFLLRGSEQTAPVPAEVAAVMPVAATPSPQPASTPSTLDVTAVPGETAVSLGSPEPTIVSITAPAQIPAVIAPSAPQKPKGSGINNITQAKMAYRAGRLSKERYRDIVNRLEEELDMAIRRAKTDYNEGRISKESYKVRVRGLKLRYEGE